ncbi:MAG: hypothetical protein IJV14_18185, partial [Lachnospiraceae bacterium]|nr:hypothetical protein [Lachnospiraceae bacterium]
MENKPETPQQQKKYTAAATLIALAVLAGVGYSVHAQQNTPEARHEMELNLGQRYQSRQEYEKAAEYYQKALAQEPADMDALKALGAVGFTDDGIPILSGDIVTKAMEKCAELNVPISFHEEDPAYIGNNGINHGRASLHYGIQG